MLYFCFQIIKETKMKNLSDTTTLHTVASVMSESFMEDPMNNLLLRGISQPGKLMASHALLHVAYAIRSQSITLLGDDPRAFIIGYDSADENSFLEKQLNLRIILKTLTSLSLKDFKKLWGNMQVHGKVLNLRWHKDFIDGRYYRIKIIAVDKQLRGTGAFRKLITPTLGYADKNLLPVVLETHNPSNVGLYEHFGFRLVKTISHPNTPITQYCMIRPARVHETTNDTNQNYESKNTQQQTADRIL
jgi:ribosomal protein S18 acetylase RimI-like enzyme